MNLKLKRDVRALTSTLFIVLVAIILIGASTVAVVLFTGQDQGSNLAKVRTGNYVEVDYVGRLVDGRVFDTSLWEVASNDALFPKSLSFSLRDESNYDPLTFTVGEGSMIEGFDRGVIGMAKGETKVIEVPYDEGYGPMDATKLFTMTLQVSLPIYQSMNTSDFASTYGREAVTGLMVQDPIYAWDALVVEVITNLDRVQVMNKPIMDHNYAVYGDPEADPSTGWYAQVIGINSAANGGEGVITLRNLLGSEDSAKVQGYDAAQSSTFYIDAVDESAGTYRMNYNTELLGRTLYFTVTLVDFK